MSIMLDSLRDMQALGSLWFLSSIYLASSDWEETHGLCRQGHRVSPEYLKVSFDTYHYTHGAFSFIQTMLYRQSNAVHFL